MFSANTSQVAANAVNYIEDVFSTYLTTGASANITVVNGIDLAGKGGMIWQKTRTSAGANTLFDTVRGVNKYLISNAANAEASASNILPTFNSDGFVIGTDNNLTTSGENGVSWTFREAPKFFDVVTYTGDGTIGRTISHSLGSVPGCIIVKKTNSASSSDWVVYHRSLGATKAMILNLTDSVYTWSVWNDTAPTSTVFSLNDASEVNGAGNSYVAYLFAHNAGGFGLTGTDNVISCGSYTGTGSAQALSLGYEPQWVLIKRSSLATDWAIWDTMRGLIVGGTDAYLRPNNPNAENSAGALDFLAPTATGLTIDPTSSGYAYVNTSGQTYIYIAIRRGPMKVPTSGTSVFYPQAISQADNIDSTGVPFPPDLVNTFSRDGTGRSSTELFQFVDRLRGLGTPNNTFTASAPRLVSSDTAAENTTSSYVQLKADSQNITRGTGWNSASYGNWIDYFWRRAPSFFDEVCYTENSSGSSQVINHNLGVIPEMIIAKSRSNISSWPVYITSGSQRVRLNSDEAAGSVSLNPTATTFDAVGNPSGYTMVTYLFATCVGVSKVGSYTGNGSTQTINCGFTGGARFVLIKRTDATGDWYVYDTARGMTTLTDPYLLMNSTAAETATLGSVTTVSTGFAVNASILAAINTNAASYIFLAIA